MSIFREKALKQMISPENLDEALVAAAPRHWLAFVAFGALVALAVLWGVLGEIPTRVTADGILLRRDSEVFSATTKGNGELIDIKVQLGDSVVAGQPVAVIEQHVGRSKLDVARKRIETARQRLNADIAARDEDTELRRSLLAKERASIRDKIGNAQRRQSILEEQVGNLKRLLEQGYIERSRLLASQNELVKVEETIADLRSSFVRLEVEDRQRAEYWTDRVNRAEKEVEAIHDEIQTLTERLKHFQAVDAPIDGVVTEIAASLGDVVSVGVPIVRIVSDATEMDAILFVPPEHGKLVKPGMTVNVEPSVAKKEEYGTVVADVRSVTDLPLSAAAIQAMLHNEKLVQRFTAAGPPVTVRANLREVGNPKHWDGRVGDHRLQWTGGNGPDFSIEPGTVAGATITVRRQAPVTLILPFLKSVTGL